MFTYLVIVNVNGIRYLTKVESTSIFNAEKLILDRGYRGVYYSTIVSCNAYGHDGIKTESFYNNMLWSELIGLYDLLELIDKQNNNIIHTDRAKMFMENKANAL